MCKIPLFLVAAILSSSAAAQEAEFFRPGPVAPATLPEQRIFPQGKTMHIGGYSPVSKPVKQLGGIVPLELAKQSGFTVAGPYYGPFAGSKATVERAAALGLHVAAQLSVPPALHFSKDFRKDRWPTVRLANLALGPQRVLILVNSAADAVQVRLKGVPTTAQLTAISGGEAATVQRTPADSSITLEPFAAVVFRVSRPRSD